MVGLLLSDGYIPYSAISKKGYLSLTLTHIMFILYIIFYLIIVLGILCLEKDIDMVNQYLVWKYTLGLRFV